MSFLRFSIKFEKRFVRAPDSSVGIVEDVEMSHVFGSTFATWLRAVCVDGLHDVSGRGVIIGHIFPIQERTMINLIQQVLIRK
jgi:hypothetical protein